MNKEKINKILEFIPLILFFITFKITDNIIQSTGILLLSTIIFNLISYIITKKISIMNIIALILIIIFGLLTILLNNDYFIKIKVTIINILFFVILSISSLVKKPLLYYLIGEEIENKKSENNLILINKLNLRYSLFFLFLAIINEIIWRNFSDQIWVNFKIFGILLLTILFTLVNIKIFSKIINVDSK